MQYKDYYQTLGVSRDASQDDIKKAYRKLARKYHPDVSKERDAEARFKDVGEAYEVLKDPEKRAAYDRFGSQWKEGQDFRPPPDWSPNAGMGSSGGFSSAEGFSDFFESLFDRARSGGFNRQGFRMRGADQQAMISITLEDAYRGAMRTIALQTREFDEQNRLVTRSRNVEVKIPPGIMESQQIRLVGQGQAGSEAGLQGDLFLEVTFEKHPWFHAEQRDIYLDLPITPWEAMLGHTVTVPTLGGKVELKVPPGSQAGRKLRLKGRGLPGNPPGDQYVVLQVVLPKADTPVAQALYRQMAREVPFNPREHLGV